MNSTHRRLGAALGTAVLAGTMLLVPAAAQATPVLTHADSPHCVVTSANLGWGMKESFRQYITGAIANGAWETSENVEYVAPSLSSNGAIEAGSDLFEWSSASGEFESSLEGGTISFAGGVHFSGHSGALELNIANPAIEFEGTDTAYLLLEIGEAPLGEAGELVRAGKIDLTGLAVLEEETLTIAEAPVRLTAEGAAKFNGNEERGSYVAGEEMAPLFLTAAVTGCADGNGASSEEPGSADEEVVTAVPISETESSVPWLPIIIGGVAVVVIIAAAALLLTGRKKEAKPGAAETDTNISDGVEP